MSDTDAPDRLSRARSEMDIAHAWLLKAESDLDHVTIPEVIVEVERDLLRATAAHSRALRELFLASLEAPVETPAEQPAKRATYVADGAYVADGDSYRRLRTISRSRGETGLVAALDRLRDFAGTEQDVRLVAERLRACGYYTSAADLLRNVEG